MSLTKQKNDQLALFGNNTDCNLKEKIKLEKISKLMDEINKKEGKNMVSLGITRNKNDTSDAIAFSSV